MTLELMVNIVDSAVRWHDQIRSLRGPMGKSGLGDNGGLEVFKRTLELHAAVRAYKESLDETED